MKQRIASGARINPDLINRVSTSLKQLHDEMSICFPNREAVINQLIYAIILREHLLLWGRTGTAKSALVKAAFSSIVGATFFETNLNKFSTEAHVVGVPDPNIARDQGRIYYRPQGMILPAHYVFLDEFLDASEPLLRTLLNILNERTFNRGEQREKANLLTAVATTNANPFALVRSTPSLEAVIDRFMFITKVEDLTSETDQVAMLKSYLEGLAPSVQISLDEIKEFSDVVINSNLLTNPVMISAYLSLFNAFEKETGKNLSDRSMAKLTQMLEASALLNNRLEIYPTDLTCLRWGLCEGDNQSHLSAFDRLVDLEIKKAEKTFNSAIDGAQLQLINTFLKEIPAKPVAGTTPEDLVQIAQKLREMEDALKGLACQLSTTEESRQKLLQTIASRRKAVEKLIFGEK